MRLIDADALEADLQKQFDKVFTEAGRKVKPEDYFIERHAVWFANVVKAENDSFFDYLKTRPTIDAEPVRHGKWIFDNHACGYYMSGSICSVCKGGALSNSAYCPHCGAKMDGGAKECR